MSKSICSLCGAPFALKSNRGRPRVKCYECSPDQRRRTIQPERQVGCKQCGDVVTGNGSRKYCSDRCKSKAKAFREGIKCSICGELMYAGKATSKDSPAHNTCRRSVGNGHGTTTSYHYGCRCAECRRAVAVRNKAYAHRRREMDGVAPSTRYRRKARGVPVESQFCSVCGDELKMSKHLEGVNPACKPCRQKTPAWLINGLPGPRQRRARARLAKAAAGRPSTGRVFTQGACNWCGEQFMSSGGSFFCSQGCRTSYRYSNSGSLSFKISPLERQAIYERDGWVCQLCNRPVDPDLGHREPWSASLDHVVPQSLMLVPDHSAQNLRLSHRLCNSYRRDTEISAEEMRALTEDRWSLALAG